MLSTKKPIIVLYSYQAIGFLLLISIVIFFLISFGLTQEEEKIPELAPLNEEFLKFQKEPRLFITSRYSDDGHPLGLLPSPHDISHLKGQQSMPRLAMDDLFDLRIHKQDYLIKNKIEDRPPIWLESLPASYDLRENNKLTPIRDQGGCGSCWAFATYGSLESFLYPAENRDFSEQNLIDEHGFDSGPCEGGNIYESVAYLARWSGPVAEADDPYNYSSDGLKTRKHIQDVVCILPRSGYLDNDPIKQAIMTYGAVYATMYYESSYYNPAYKSYYNPKAKEGPHAVAIVGWDDNFDRYKFNVLPGEKGSFIVRNSWGRNWGEYGYFYVSYYDEFLAQRDLNAIVKAETFTNYEIACQYDYLGWVSSLGYSGSDTAWFANVFVSNSNMPLTGVSFYAAATLNSYEIYIYRDVTSGQPRSGALVGTKEGDLNSPGYFTVPLDNSIPLTPDQRFSVVIKLKTRNYNYPIPIEKPFDNYSSRARANAGESFVSHDGNEWNDLPTSWRGIFSNSNVCIKAFAGYPPLFPPLNFKLQRLENDFIFFKEHINKLSWDSNPQNKTSIQKYKIYRKTKISADTAYQLLTELPSSVLSYADRGLKKEDVYSYWITAIDEYNRESEPTEVSN